MILTEMILNFSTDFERFSEHAFMISSVQFKLKQNIKKSIKRLPLLKIL